MKKKIFITTGFCFILFLGKLSFSEEVSYDKKTTISSISTEEATVPKHESVIQNWWSWERRQEVAPFGYSLINFAIFLIILHQTALKQLRIFLKNRNEQLRTLFDEASQKKQSELSAVALYESQIQELPTKKLELLAQMRKEADAEEVRIASATEIQMKRLKKDVETTVEQEKRKILQQIRQETADAAVSWAEQILNRSLQPSDHQRLLHIPLVQLERAAQKNANPVSEGAL